MGRAGFQDKLNDIAALIRGGRDHEARAGVRLLLGRKLNREERLSLAFLANNARWPRLAARLLHRVVRDPRGGQASLEEQVEYGRALLTLGLTGEAIRLLGALDGRALPRVNRFLALAHFRRWNWNAALPAVRAHLESSALNSEQRAAGEVLLALATLHGQGDLAGARAIARQVVAHADVRLIPAVHLDALQVLAQTHYLEKDWSPALKCLDRMDQIYPQTVLNLYSNISRKWRCLIELEREGRHETLVALDEVRARFRAMTNHEQVRSCDFYQALALDDELRLKHVCFGSPYPGLRAKLLRASGRSAADFGSHFDLRVGELARPRRLVLDTRNGRATGCAGELKAGGALQRLLGALTADFYVPPEIFQLHEGVFPTEHFNPDSSPARVRQLLKRLREWLKRSRLPLRLLEDQGHYLFHSRTDVRLRVGLEVPVNAFEAEFLSQLQAGFGAGWFSAGQVENRFRISRSSAVAFLRAAVSQGRVERSGQSSATRYRLCPRPEGSAGKYQ